MSEPVDFGHRIQVFADMVLASHGIGVWCFDGNRKLYYSTSSHEQDFLTFFRIGGCMDYAYEHGLSIEKPFLMSDTLGLVWMGEALPSPTGEPLLFVTGPVFTTSSSLEAIAAALRKEHRESFLLRSELMQDLLNIPVVTMTLFMQLGVMMHCALTRENIPQEDIGFQVKGTPLFANNAAGDYTLAEWEQAAEDELMDCIRTGNQHFMSVFSERVRFCMIPDCGTGVPLREGKNAVLVLNALCCRAAMQGGLSVRTARFIERDQARKIEAATSITELYHVRVLLVSEYVERVHASRASDGLSKEIRELCEYLSLHPEKNFTVAELAAFTGYTEYYLTKKFQKETGLRLHDYIKREKVRIAQQQLAQTGKGIQEIASGLGFSTRNYFSRVFKEVTGQSPQEYRKSYYDQRGEDTDEKTSVLGGWS